MPYYDHIEQTEANGGVERLRGTPVSVDTVIALLAEGNTVESILKMLPALRVEQVNAVIEYAAETMRDMRKKRRKKGKRPLGLYKGQVRVLDGFKDPVPDHEEMA